MQPDHLSVEEALDNLRTVDSEFGARATSEADSWRRRFGAPSGAYSYPDLPAYQDFYPSFVSPRTSLVLRIVRRIGLASWSRVRIRRVGDYQMFVGPQCDLPGDFGTTIADTIRNSTEDFLYGDSVHYVLGENADYTHQLRPGWSPERLRSHCYVGEVIVARIDVVRRAGGRRRLRKLSSHDRALRLAETSRTHRHLGRVLYTSPLSAAAPQADENAVEGHLLRAGIEAHVEKVHSLGSVKVTRTKMQSSKVCVIVPTRGTRATIAGADRVMAGHALSSLLAMTTDCEVEILVVVDEDTPEEARTDIRSACQDSARFIEFPGPFNFAKKINLAAVQTDAEFLLLMNDDTEVLTPNAMNHLLSFFEDETVGLVSPLLVFEDGLVQSAGHLLNPMPFDLYRGFPVNGCAGWGMLGATRETSSLIAAFLLVRRDLFVEVGGLSEKFPSDYNDVDFALKAAMAGKSAIVTPHAVCAHFESKTRRAVLDPESVARLGERWQHVLENDPYGNRFLQPFEFVWKSNEATPASLDSAMGFASAWDREEWDRLQAEKDRHLHRTMFLPRWIKERAL